MDDAPLLLTGNQRSGTTFTARVIGAHPRAAVGNEDGLIRMAALWFPALAGPDGAGLPYARFQEFLRALELRGERGGGGPGGARWRALSARVEAVLAAWQQDGTLEEWTRRRDVDAFVRRLCHAVIGSGGAQPPLAWGDKYPEFLFQLERLDAIFPRARWLFVVRRPESNVEALARKLPADRGAVVGKAVFTLEACAWQWLDWNARWLGFRARIPAARRLELRYEDLIADPAAAVAQIGAFAGLDLLAADACRAELQRLDAGRAERWKASPRAAEIQDLCRGPAWSEMLAAFGYR
jgi:hypothetical protein